MTRRSLDAGARLRQHAAPPASRAAANGPNGSQQNPAEPFPTDTERTMDKPHKKPASAPDALDLLKADHDKVKSLFREFEDLRGSDDEDERKGELVDEICYELTMHTMIEDEIFYPVLRSVIDDDDMMDEADVEHAGARELISQLEVMYPGDDHYDATVTVLGEEIAHHIDKEESDMFDAARAGRARPRRAGRAAGRAQGGTGRRPVLAGHLDRRDRTARQRPRRRRAHRTEAGTNGRGFPLTHERGNCGARRTDSGAAGGAAASSSCH